VWWDLFDRFHQGRCAVCNSAAHLVLDHDHQTGLVRGDLCYRCNGYEGRCQGERSAYGRYRARPPTSILNIQLRYFNPATSEYDMGYTLSDPARRWIDNPMRGIGL
jgi:Recombination endonuclease VII